MAKIVIDARMVNESGIGRYLRNLISNLHVLDKKNEYFILLLKKDYASLEFNKIATSPAPESVRDPRNDRRRINFHKILADFRWYTFEEQIRLPRILKRINADLVHFPHFNVPIFYSGKFVVTVHDLIHQSFSMDRSTHTPLVYGLKHLGYKKIFENAVNKAEKILVPSGYVKKQLMGNWRIKGDKILVTHEAAEDKLLSTGNKLATVKSQKILEKLGVKPPYIFYVGNAHPHKNVEGLIKAFLQLKKLDSSPRTVWYRAQNDRGGLQLVLSGQDNYFWQKIKSDSRFRGNDILYTGFVTDEELVALYKNAKCFVMPSFEEGFGLPILEAFAMGCPVVSSNGASLPEIGGDAAIYFNPRDERDMIGKIHRVLSDEKLRKDLTEKGRKRAKIFSWQKMAEQTLKIYKKVI